MRIFNPFRLPFGAEDLDRLQPMIILVTEDEREQVIEYLSTISMDPVVDIHASGFLVMTQEAVGTAFMVSNARKGFGCYA